MAGRPPEVHHVRESFMRATQSSLELIRDVQGVTSIKVKPNTLHPEQARRIGELAFLGMISAWEEFLEQSFVRYLAGARAKNGYQPALRVGAASGISHSYHLLAGDPNFDPSRSYAKFSSPTWIISISKVFFENGAPYATQLHANLQILHFANHLRNRVAHSSKKARYEFKQAALQHLGLPATGTLPQGYRVGDLMLSRANHLFGQQVKDRGHVYFVAYGNRLRQMAKVICPE